MKGQRKLLSRKTSRGRNRVRAGHVRVIRPEDGPGMSPNAIPLIGRVSISDLADIERVLDEDIRLTEDAIERGNLVAAIRHAFDVSESLGTMSSSGRAANPDLVSRARRVVTKVLKAAEKSVYKESYEHRQPRQDAVD